MVAMRARTRVLPVGVRRAVRRTIATSAFLVAATVACPRAFGDDKKVCLAAAAQGQTLRDAHKLVEAREQFRTCAREQCPRVVQKDCVAWLSDVEKNLPSVVLTAKDEAGADIVEGKVSVDGK